MDSSAENDKRIKISQALCLKDYLVLIGNWESVSYLLDELMSSELIEIRIACLNRLIEIYNRSPRQFFMYGQKEKIEFAIRSFFEMDSNSEVAQKLLSLYVFNPNESIFKDGVNFAISLFDKSQNSFELLRPLSKIVCSRLNDHCPHECYDGDWLKVTINSVFPGLKDFLTEVLHWGERPNIGNDSRITRKNPLNVCDFYMAERALKVIVRYRKHDQCFLPTIESMIQMHKDGLLVFCSTPSDPFFESAKSLAVLKEAAKILTKAKSEN